MTKVDMFYYSLENLTEWLFSRGIINSKMMRFYHLLYIDILSRIFKQT